MAISRHRGTYHKHGYIAISHGELAILLKIGILEGKSKIRNEQALTLLYDLGPLSTWEIAKKTSAESRHSLNSTFNKSLRKLEEKGYVHRDATKSRWLLTFKGITTVLIMLPKPRIWNSIWKDRFGENAKRIREDSKKILGYSQEMIDKSLEIAGVSLEDYEAWVQFANVVRNIDYIDFDRIRDKQLLTLIVAEAHTLEEISAKLRPIDKVESEKDLSSPK